MDTTLFTSDSPGTLIRNLDGHWAFLPSPLPAKIRWTDRLITALSQADRALGQLASLGPRIKHPHRLVHLFLRREAELSSRIENTFASVRSMLLFEDIPAIADGTPQVQEVENNYLALQFAIGSLAERGLTVSLLKEAHQILLKNVRGADKQPGQFRSMQAHIGRSNDIRLARFVPPPPQQVPSAMQALLDYATRGDELPPLVRAAMAHYQFEAIHPFADGNGRIGRALILMMLCAENVLPTPLFNPSAPLERCREEYYDLLLAVSQKGDWSSWLEFFALGIAAEAGEARARLEALENLRRMYDERLRSTRQSRLIPRLLDYLFEQPKVSMKSAAQVLEVGFTSAKMVVTKLVEADVLREVTGRYRHRLFIAHEIVDIFRVNHDQLDQL